jgi:hypothetical protein
VRHVPWSGWAPLLAVAAAAAFGLVTLWPELTPVANLNDTPLHASMVRWAEARLAGGATPFDGWYPYLGQGFPQFHHYQTLPHLVTAPLATVLGGDRSVAWTLYLLLSLWPVSVYAGARLMGWGRWEAAGAAVVAPLVVSASGYGYEQSSYTWQGYGAWSQLWGMWLLPLAWGLTWRAVRRGRGAALAALVLGATLGAHVLTGYLALVSLAAWVLVGRAGAVRRVARAVVVGAGGLLAAAWVLVPALDDDAWANYAGYERETFWYDSFGARKVLGWLLSGSLYDEGRLPVVTALVAAGLVVCARRWRGDLRARATVLVWGLSLVLFFGRPTLGPLLEVLPGSDDLFLHRFVIGVHLGGVLLAGIGGSALARTMVRRAGRLPTLSSRPAVLVVGVAALILVALSPAWRERAAYAGKGRAFVEVQEAADREDGSDLAPLIEELRWRGDGRAYAGMPFNWGRAYRVGYVPVYAELLNADVDALGFTLRVASLSTAVEVLFDETNPEHYAIFNVRYLLLPMERRPPVPASLVLASGRHRLWRVEAEAGYVQVVDPAPPARADRTTLAAVVGPTLSAEDAAARRPTVAFAGAQVAPGTSGGGGRPGTVEPLSDSPESGTFAARVRLDRPASVVLASSFHPRWRVTVDGREAPLQLVAPSFVGVGVDEGEHAVVFRYEPYPWTVPLLLLGAAVIGVLGLGPVARRRWRRRPAVRRTGPPPRAPAPSPAEVLAGSAPT